MAAKKQTKARHVRARGKNARGVKNHVLKSRDIVVVRLGPQASVVIREAKTSVV